MALKNKTLRNEWGAEQKDFAVAISSALIVDLSSGNIGAIRVLVNLTRDFGPGFMEPLQKNGIGGSEIWLLYKDVCGEDMDALAQALADGTALGKLKECRYSSFYREKR